MRNRCSLTQLPMKCLLFNLLLLSLFGRADSATAYFSITPQIGWRYNSLYHHKTVIQDFGDNGYLLGLRTEAGPRILNLRTEFIHSKSYAHFYYDYRNFTGEYRINAFLINLSSSLHIYRFSFNVAAGTGKYYIDYELNPKLIPGPVLPIWYGYRGRFREWGKNWALNLSFDLTDDNKLGLEFATYKSKHVKFDKVSLVFSRTLMHLDYGGFIK